MIMLMTLAPLSVIVAEDNNQDNKNTLINAPEIEASKMIIDVMASLRELSDRGLYTKERVSLVVREKLIPNINIEYATKRTLMKHWNSMGDGAKDLFKKYIIGSLVKDYMGALTSYDKINSVILEVDPKVRRKGNLAKVNIRVKINNAQKKFLIITVGMIRDKSGWKVYDIIFSGVSIIKNYREQFNSYIKRKGMHYLLKKITKKVEKYNI